MELIFYHSTDKKATNQIEYLEQITDKHRFWDIKINNDQPPKL